MIPDLVAGSPVVTAKVAALKEEARAEIARIEQAGGALAAVESGYMKAAPRRSQADRLARINKGEIAGLGRNRRTQGPAAPPVSGEDGGPFQFEPNSAARTAGLLRP